MIRFENVTMVYDNGHRALNNINLTIGNGEFVFIVGRAVPANPPDQALAEGN